MLFFNYSFFNKFFFKVVHFLKAATVQEENKLIKVLFYLSNVYVHKYNNTRNVQNNLCFFLFTLRAPTISGYHFYFRRTKKKNLKVLHDMVWQFFRLILSKTITLSEVYWHIVTFGGYKTLNCNFEKMEKE